MAKTKVNNALAKTLHPNNAEYPLHSNFINKKGFVWYHCPKGKKKEGEKETPPLKICGSIKILSRTRDKQKRNHGRLIEFHDFDQNRKLVSIACSELQHDGHEVRKRLTDEGLWINPDKAARALLNKLILNSEPTNTSWCVGSTGWHDDIFVLADRSIGSSGNECIFQPKDFAPDVDIRCQGSLEGWQKLAGLAEGNSRIILAISIQFAAPLLSILNIESGGFNIFGNSSIGKSTALFIACSVNGSHEYRQQWSATKNGLEEACSAHNDLCQIIDEAGEMEPKDLGKICYMITNERGKKRMNSPTRKWKTMILSSAEKTLAQFMSEDGRRVNAGQTVRLVDIPADAGKGFGIYEDIKGYSEPAVFGETLKELARNDYGHPLEHYLINLSKIIKENKLGLIARANSFIAQFLKDNLIQGADGQVRRVVSRFALVAFAGELATEQGITGWPEGEATKQAIICLTAWLNHRGGIGSEECQMILRQVQYFFQKHFDRGFVDVENADANPPDRKGFRKKVQGTVEYWVLPEIFNKEICDGFDIDLVRQYCLEAGYIIPGNNGRSQQQRRIPLFHGDTHTASKKVYVFSDKVLGDDEED